MFDDHYEVFLADTIESKDIHYSIRYQVYCEEMGFENKDKFPLEMESDEYDKHSTHFIVRTKDTGQWVGAMRVIIKNDQLLPLEEHCTLNKIINNDDIFNRSIEISRLCLIKDIRRRSSDTNHPSCLENQNINNKDDSVIPLHTRKHLERSIIWGLIRAGALHCKQQQIKNWYFFVSNALARIICKKGFNLKQIGDSINFNGKRCPFEIPLKEVLSNPLWTNDFKNGYCLYSDMDMDISGSFNEKVSSVWL